MKNKIPTIIGIVFLIVGVAAGVLLIQNRQVFRLGASPEEAPKDVRITNISDRSFTVSWVTDRQVEGFIEYGEDESSLDRTELDEISGNSNTHFLTVQGLKPQTDYFFKINSAGNDYDNNGSSWKLTTGATLQQPRKTELISGTVLTASGSPAKNAIVYVNVGGGIPLSTTTSDSGSWLIPISETRSQDLSSFVQVDPANTVVEISVQAGPLGVASAQIYSQSAKPVPPLVLGEVKDFKNLPPSDTDDIPQASFDLPEDASPSSGFEVDETPAPETSDSVTIESHSEGEIVSTTQPEFFGEGPPGTTITVTVESNHQVTDEVTISSAGTWSWSPPEDLEEGTHKITLRWRDASGILRTITRTFVVQAAEDDPAFEATPSGSSPSPTPTPTPTPTASPTATATSSATPAPVPEPGTLTPTYLLSIMGVGLLGLSAVAAFLALQEK